MKELGNKFIAQAHVFILLYGMYGFWIQYDENAAQKEELVVQLPQLDQDISRSQKKISEIQEFIKKTDEYKARVEGVAKNIEEVQKQLPADINDSQILSFFNAEINSLNIKDPSLIPGAEEASTYFISKDFNLKAKGTFLQFLILLERIGNAARIYNIKSLKFVAAEDTRRGRFQILTGSGVIQAFRYNPDFRVDRGFDKIEKIK